MDLEKQIVYDLRETCCKDGLIILARIIARAHMSKGFSSKPELTEGPGGPIKMTNSGALEQKHPAAPEMDNYS